MKMLNNKNLALIKVFKSILFANNPSKCAPCQPRSYHSNKIENFIEKSCKKINYDSYIQSRPYACDGSMRPDHTLREGANHQRFLYQWKLVKRVGNLFCSIIHGDECLWWVICGQKLSTSLFLVIKNLIKDLKKLSLPGIFEK